MIDIASQLNAIHRQVEKQLPADGSGECVSVLMRRSYDAPVGDVWDAVTQPDRIKRWLMPISGELRVGGNFQLEGNAGGEILTCEPPSLLRVTFGAPTSIVEVRLTPDGDRDTVLELEHTVPIEMAQSGAGALYVGPGWDGALMGLGLFLRGEAVGDPVAAANSPEAQEFSKQSVHAWVEVVKGSGTATAEQLAAAIEVSLAQFAPDAATPPHQQNQQTSG
ncbi:MAG TPA: SRPBCC family protein [Actinomycetes bacterium]|nr:SRPBCC family protein [Actinomycetes bacterium]